MPLFSILSWRSVKEIKINKNNERELYNTADSVRLVGVVKTMYTTPTSPALQNYY